MAPILQRRADYGIPSLPLETPSEWLPVLAESELGEDEPRAVRIAGERIVLVRHNGRCAAMDRFCPHESGDLSKGRILANALKCPLHGFMYGLETGRGINCRGRFSVRMHELRIENGMIHVRINQAPPHTEADPSPFSRNFRLGAE
jgi:nitrite reductase/ring-hydroxylating ferredoxin subunit